MDRRLEAVKGVLWDAIDHGITLGETQAKTIHNTVEDKMFFTSIYFSKIKSILSE